MKKKLEAELISIAHRILKLKNKSDINQLYQETQRLYEKLSVLRFVEEHLGDVKPTIGQAEIEEKITAAYDNAASEMAMETSTEEVKAEETLPKTEEPAEEPEATPQLELATEEATQEPVSVQPEAVIEEQEEAISEAEFDQPAELAGALAETSEIPAEATKATEKTEDTLFKPAFELSFEAKGEENEATPEEIVEDAKGEFKDVNTQITFEDILGSSYVDPIFVKPEDLEREIESKKADNVIPIGRNFSEAPVISINKEERSYTLNDRISKGITIGLNDRVAFMKHLFNNSSEDYNRVLSQLITFDTFAEAKSFIDNMVKPDYNNWDSKEEYAERFMEIIEKKFS